MTLRKKIFVGVPVAAVLLVGLMGVLHMPFARPALAWIGFGCPIPQATPEEIEAARLTSARAARGSTPAAERPALGFELDAMSKTDVEAWAEKHQVRCTPLQKGTVLRCEDVPASVFGSDGTINDMTFKFEPKQLKLVTVTTLRNQLDAATAAAELNTITARLEDKLGGGRRVGTPTEQYLASGPMRTAMTEYRFSNYIASVSATNLGRRVAVREHYMSAVD